MTSSYHYQLGRYLEFFARDQVLILSFEEMILDMNDSLNAVCAFLGIDRHDFRTAQKAFNQSDQKYWIWKYDLFRKSLPRPLRKLYHTFFYGMSIKIEKPRLTDRTLGVLKDRLLADVHAFRNLAGRPFDWPNFQDKHCK
jgi:hypothetical protein